MIVISFSSAVVFILLISETSLFLPQIKALRRERVEIIVGKEELVDDPMENGIMHLSSGPAKQTNPNTFLMRSASVSPFPLLLVLYKRYSGFI